MRYVIRSSCNLPTARRLKEALGASRIVRAKDSRFTPDYNRDLFLGLPEPARALNTPEGYSHLRSFFRAPKGVQRLLMKFHSELPIIPTKTSRMDQLAGDRFVVRPNRHRSGQDYRITTDQNDFDPRTEYISTLIAKDKEYRVVFYKGKHVCTYLKSNPNNLAVDQPWTHSNGCVFLTINNARNDSVSSSGLIDKLSATIITKTAHLVAYDILRAGTEHYVCEANLAPGISIPSTIQKIVSIEGE